MRAEELRNMSDSQIRQQLEDARQELFNLRFQIETRKLKNHRRVPEVKRDIARFMTTLRERELIRMYGGGEGIPADTQEPVAQETSGKRRGLFGRLGR